MLLDDIMVKTVHNCQTGSCRVSVETVKDDDGKDVHNIVIAGKA
jgi:hypothetical protein